MAPPRGIIVLEGADASGKTTLANYFREKYGARYLHSTVRRDIWRWHLGALNLACKLADHHLVVLDRHWLSELIYGLVFRGGPAYDLGARSIDRVLRKHGALYVLCVPSDVNAQLKVHADRWAAGTEKFRSISKVIQLYHEVTHGNRFAGQVPGYLGTLTRKNHFNLRDDTFVYDYTSPSYSQVSGGIKRAADRIIGQLAYVRDKQFEHCLNYTTQNINGRPRTGTDQELLFVGEQVSPQVKPGQPTWPFVWNDQLSAVTYVNAALQLLDFDETLGIWTNARPSFTKEADDRMRRILFTRKWRKVIVMGRVALDAYGGRGQNTVHLPHPQFHRRFHHDPMEYAKIIREAIA